MKSRPNAMLIAFSFWTVGALSAGCVATNPRAAAGATAPAVAPAAASKLPAKAERVAVTIYEFRSDVPEIGARGATDMFKTALVGNGRFRIVERARLSEGVVREKQLNANGQSTGSSAQKQVTAAEYIFEAAITELSAGDRNSQGGVNIAGLQIGGSSSSDSIGIDVRIIDANSAEVLDAIALRRALKSSGTQVSGTMALLQNVLAQRGKSASIYTPDASLQTSRKDSVDQTLRALIDEAVAQLAARF